MIPGLGPSTLYDNRQKLLDNGIVEESPRASSTKDVIIRRFELGVCAGLFPNEVGRIFSTPPFEGTASGGPEPGP
jgi:hypothetical protein